jgi:hypothetical protein
MAPTQPNLKSQPELQMERSMGESRAFILFSFLSLSKVYFGPCVLQIVSSGIFLAVILLIARFSSCTIFSYI